MPFVRDDASPLARPALFSTLAASGALALAALAAGTVRLLPWFFDPRVPWRVAAPFARGLGSVALETALLVGWPLGWSLASVRLVERGEALALQSLGEPPARTVSRLGPQALLFAAAIGLVASVWGRDATAPGRVATELIAQGKAACLVAEGPTTFAVPFTELTWLCPGPALPNAGVRLTGRAPAALSGAVFTASDAFVAGDFRRIDLSDARLLLTPPAETARKTGMSAVEVHVGALSLRGLAPFSRASTLPPWLRALVFSVTACGAAAMAAVSLLRPRRETFGSGVRPRTRLAAFFVGSAGPVCALGLLRLADRAEWPAAAYLLMPMVGVLGAFVMAEVVARLPLLGAAASKYRGRRARLWGTSASPKS